MNTTFEVIIIGAGHAGLTASYFLKQSGVAHIVLEGNTIGASWRSQRWDSFLLNTTNEKNCLWCGCMGDLLPRPVTKQ